MRLLVRPSRAEAGRAGQCGVGQYRAGQGVTMQAGLTGRQVSGAAVRLMALSASKVSLVTSHLLEVSKKLNEADHAILVCISLFHLCAQRLGCFLVLQQCSSQTAESKLNGSTHCMQYVDSAE